MPDSAQDRAASSSDHGFVTTSDVSDNSRVYRYLLFTAAGSLKVTSAAGVTYTIPSLPAGTYFFGEVRRVWATGGTLNASAGTTVIGFP